MSKVETHSETWRAVKAKAEKGLDEARRTLEAHGHPIEQTEYQRGRIKAYREILDLAAERPVIQSDDPLY